MNKDIIETVSGISYTKPKVLLLQHTGLGIPELAARTCYDSFDNSENDCIKSFDFENPIGQNIDLINNIESSELLDSLAWTHFHHSILEHANLSFLVRGTSRGVLQEHARHRIQAISVRSTRYTMSSVINAFVASTKSYVGDGKRFFSEKILGMDMFVISDDRYKRLEAFAMYDKLQFQLQQIGLDAFIDISVSKSSKKYIDTIIDADELFKILEEGKKKRNVGDNFKHIISDNVAVDMVVTFNLRSLKNYFELRNSGAAYFQIQWLAQEMIRATPEKYLKLIMKEDKIRKVKDD